MKYYIGLFILLLFIGCISNKCYTVYQIDNGEDYIQDGMRRIVDRRGRIGYIDRICRIYRCNVHEIMTHARCILYPSFYFNKNFSARPGEKSSHREATVQPGAKILL